MLNSLRSHIRVLVSYEFLQEYLINRLKDILNSKVIIAYDLGTEVHANGSSRIVGGETVGLGSSLTRVPWHVGLVDKNLMVFCGGALLNEKFILTAAHCVYGWSNPRKVLIGSTSRQDRIYSSMLHLLTEDGEIHPDFETFDWRPPGGSFDIYDLMIVTLKEPLEFVCADQFARLPFNIRNEDRLAGKSLILSGWGSTVSLSYDESIFLIDDFDDIEFQEKYGKWPDNYPQVLKVLKTRYLPYNICQKRYQEFFNTYQSTTGTGGHLKMGDLRISQQSMLCTSQCTFEDLKKCKNEHTWEGFCVGDSGGSFHNTRIIIISQ